MVADAIGIVRSVSVQHHLKGEVFPKWLPHCLFHFEPFLHLGCGLHPPQDAISPGWLPSLATGQSESSRDCCSRSSNQRAEDIAICPAPIREQERIPFTQLQTESRSDCQLQNSNKTAGEPAIGTAPIREQEEITSIHTMSWLRAVSADYSMNMALSDTMSDAGLFW